MELTCIHSTVYGKHDIFKSITNLLIVTVILSKHNMFFSFHDHAYITFLVTFKNEIE